MATTTETRRAVAQQPPGPADGLAIHDGDRSVRLKWHKLRRRSGDLPFLRANLDAGLALGASLEVDIQPLADGTFVCLHDDRLEAETSGTGRVADADSAAIRRLRQIDASGAATEFAPLLLAELVATLRQRGAAEGATVQLDLKATARAITDAVADRFAELVRPAAPLLSLSGEDWPAVLRLGGGVEGLSLGFDPTPLVLENARAAADLARFAENVLALGPEAKTVYLHHSVFAAARGQRTDLAAIFHDRDVRVDCWTIGTDRDNVEAKLRLAMESGVDQITTDTPADLQALWATMAGRRD